LRGAIAFANCLFFSTNLLCVSLARNRIGDAGTVALVGALSVYLLNEQGSTIVDKLVNDESKQKISDEGGPLLKTAPQKGTRQNNKERRTGKSASR
jgi:hypothetical protein